SILERKQEIGNLRANGESKSDVMKLILCEGAFLGVLGSLFGLALTYFVATVIFEQGILMPPGPGSTRQFFISFQFTVPMAAYTLALSIVSAIIASYLAGLKVTRMPIAQALRSY
ncbi:MAG: FtsX-like permease family protein, partial [Chlamydiota bacterium]